MLGHNQTPEKLLAVCAVLFFHQQREPLPLGISNKQIAIV